MSPTQFTLLSCMIDNPDRIIQKTPHDDSWPDWSSWERGMPYPTRKTFGVLIKRGWIRVFQTRPRQECFSAVNYYEPTERGRAMVESLRAKT